MNQSKHHTINISTYRTNAPDGHYRVMSNIACDCCNHHFTSFCCVTVREGEYVPHTIDIAAGDLVRKHPEQSCLTEIEWHGNDTLGFTFEVAE